jgi:hypothetical protein
MAKLMKIIIENRKKVFYDRKAAGRWDNNNSINYTKEIGFHGIRGCTTG